MSRTLAFLITTSLAAVLGLAAFLVITAFPGTDSTPAESPAFELNNDSDALELIPGPTEAAEPGAERTEAQLIRQSLQSVVGVRTAGACGSGFAVGRTTEGTVIATCSHVLQAETSLSIILPDGSQHDVEVLRSDVDQDLALLLAPGVHDVPILPFGVDDDLETVDPLYVVGFSLGTELLGDPSITKGILSGRRMVDGVDYLQTDAVMNPGNSGGPVLNHQGEVVGVASWGIRGTAEFQVEGINFATPVALVQRQLDLVNLDLVD